MKVLLWFTQSPDLDIIESLWIHLRHEDSPGVSQNRKPFMRKNYQESLKQDLEVS